MEQQHAYRGLRAIIAAGGTLKGSFVKTPGSSSVEILASVGFDFVVIDQEHGVFDKSAIDYVLLAAKAAGIPATVRIPSLTTEAIASALDCGADGILAPHISSAADAANLVELCRYRGGRRGFSGMTRAGNYGGRKMWDHVDGSDAAIGVIAMIEDPAAIPYIDEITAVNGLDAVFIGRGDLTVAMEAPSRDSPPVVDAVDHIIQSAKRNGKAIWMMVDSAEEAMQFSAKGVSGFIISSDQALLRRACALVSTEFDTHFRADGHMPHGQ